MGRFVKETMCSALMLRAVAGEYKRSHPLKIRKIDRRSRFMYIGARKSKVKGRRLNFEIS